MDRSGGGPRTDPFLAAGLALAACLWLGWLLLFVLRTAARPPHYSNEGELLYEASRIARGLALYTDPIAGARDDGPLPVRHYVLYGPLAPHLLSLLPEPVRLVGARALSALAWFAAIPLLALTGRGKLRLTGFVVALSYAGLFLLARDAIYFTLTPLPVLLSTAALALVARRDALELPSMVLLVLAAALKPVAIGIALGVGAAALLDGRRPWSARLRNAGLFLCVGAAAVGLLQWSTEGRWLADLSAATNNGFLPQRWLAFGRDYFVVAGLPHLLVAGALLRSGRHRWTGAALLASSLWAVLIIAKRGGNVGYFMEPSAVLGLAIAWCDGPALGTGGARLLRWAAPAIPLLSGLQAIPYYLEQGREQPAQQWAQVSEIQRRCLEAAPGGSALGMRSGLPEMEYALTGRVTLAPWQTAVLADAGRFPQALLVADLDEPALGCLVHRDGLEGPPPPAIQADGEYTRFDILFDVHLRQEIRARFEPFATVGEWHLFRRKRGEAL
jgi:hypothetical protein